MDTAHLLSRQRRPQSYRVPIQLIDGRCDRVRASTHRWLDVERRVPPPNLSNACSPPLPPEALRLARLFNIEPSAQALSATYLDNDCRHERPDLAKCR